MPDNWFGTLSLSYKLALAFGIAFTFVLLCAIIKVSINRYRLRKYGKRLPSDPVTPVRAGDEVEACEKGENSLFGIRAIEAGYFGGVPQSPSNSLPTTPRASIGGPGSSPRASPNLGPVRGNSGLYAPGASSSTHDADYDPDAIRANFRQTPSRPMLRKFASETSLQYLQGRSSTSPSQPPTSEGKSLQPSTAQLLGHHSHDLTFLTQDRQARGITVAASGSDGDAASLEEAGTTAQRAVFRHSETLDTLTSAFTEEDAESIDQELLDWFIFTIDRPSTSGSLDRPRTARSAQAPKSLHEREDAVPPVPVREAVVPSIPGQETRGHLECEPASTDETPDGSPRSSTATVGAADNSTAPTTMNDTPVGRMSPACGEIHVARPAIRVSNYNFPAFPIKSVIVSSNARFAEFRDERKHKAGQDGEEMSETPRASAFQEHEMEHEPNRVTHRTSMPDLAQNPSGPFRAMNTSKPTHASLDLLQLQLRFQDPAFKFTLPEIRPRSPLRLSLASTIRPNRNSAYVSHRSSHIESVRSSFSFAPTQPEYLRSGLPEEPERPPLPPHPPYRNGRFCVPEQYNRPAHQQDQQNQSPYRQMPQIREADARRPLSSHPVTPQSEMAESPRRMQVVSQPVSAEDLRGRR